MASSNERSYSATSIRNGLVAGYTAGITGIVVGHPLDSVKVLLQTGGVVPGAQRSFSQSSASTATKIAHTGHVITWASSNAAVAQSSAVKANVSTVAVASSSPSPIQPKVVSQASVLGKRSLRSLYAGVTGPLLTTGILQSLNFAIYDSARRILYQHQIQSENQNGIIHNGKTDDYLHYDNLSSVAIASFVAGASTSVLTSPVVTIKTKQQLMVWGFRKAIRETYHSGKNGKPQILNGLRNFYTGFGMTFLCDSFGRSIYMFSYELFKRQLAGAQSNEQSTPDCTDRVSTQNLSMPERMLCAASAGMVCWAAIFPADVIRSKLYAKSLTTQSSLTTLDGVNMARQMVRDQGFMSLYRGVGITVARAGPVAAAVLPVYDFMLDWVSSE